VTPEERLIREFFGAADSSDIPRALDLMTQDVRFRFGSADPTIGHAAVAAAYAAIAEVVASMSHELLTVWRVTEPENAVLCEIVVTYRRHDGSTVTLPSLNVVRLRDGRIADYRIYMDVNPLFGQH
jgi:ketosteroid isomerase-like protein